MKLLVVIGILGAIALYSMFALGKDNWAQLSKRQKYNMCKIFFKQYELAQSYSNIAYDIIYDKPYTSKFAKEYYKNNDDFVGFCYLVVVEYADNKCKYPEELIDIYLYFRKHYSFEAQKAMNIILNNTSNQYKDYFNRRQNLYRDSIKELYGTYKEKYGIEVELD